MENEFQVLEKSLKSFLELLEDRQETNLASSKLALSDAIHTELIDFDKLCESISDAIECLARIENLEADIEIVRNWFSNRCSALKRARRALVLHQYTDKPNGAPQKASISEMIHEYEEEMSRMRKINGGESGSGTQLSRKKLEEIREYRS